MFDSISASVKLGEFFDPGTCSSEVVSHAYAIIPLPVFFMLLVDSLRLFPNYLMIPLICFCFFYRLIDLPLFYGKVDEVPEFELTFSAITGLPLHTGKSQSLYLIRQKIHNCI